MVGGGGGGGGKTVVETHALEWRQHEHLADPGPNVLRVGVKVVHRHQPRERVLGLAADLMAARLRVGTRLRRRAGASQLT